MMDRRRRAAGIRGCGAEGTPKQTAQRRRRGAKFAAMAALLVAMLAPPSGTAGPIEPRSGYLDQTLLRLNCTSSSPPCLNGAFPITGGVVYSAGNLYGIVQGGRFNDGAVFELTPTQSGWKETVIYNFCSKSNCTDGAYANGLIIDSYSGDLYGTTVEGGSGDGVAFELTPPTPPNTAWRYTLLYTFCQKSNCADGAYPYGKLVLGASGNLYGTASQGGSSGGGVVFELTLNQSRTAWTENVLYNFCAQSKCADGQTPLAGLLLDAAGNLYGTTASGGTGVYGPYGTVFELSPPTPPGTAWTYAQLYSFTNCPGCPDGADPEAPLIMDSAGNLYGTTLLGGDGAYCTQNNSQNGSCGAVFELSPPTVPGSAWSESVLYSFCSQPNCADGWPYAAVGQTVWQGIDSSGGLRFGCARVGVSPAATPACEQISVLGPTFGGGKPGCHWNLGCGVVFALTPNLSQTVWTESVLYRFCSQGNCDDGYGPTGGVAADAFGNLYGITYVGGGTTGGFCVDYQGCGVVYQLVLPPAAPLSPGITAGTRVAPGLPQSAATPSAPPGRPSGGLNALHQ